MIFGDRAARRRIRRRSDHLYLRAHGVAALRGDEHVYGFPYVEDVREVGNYDVAILGAPLEIETTFCLGPRFGAQGIRQACPLRYLHL